MQSNRREFLKAGGTAAVGLTLAAATTAAAETAARGPLPKSTRKLIIRADDVGHSKVCNIGTFEAIDHGVVSAVDMMLDSPGSEDAMARLRGYPWMSVGWHMHMWGAPVIGAAHGPSLVEKGGQFDGRFRMDLVTAQDVKDDEVLAELRAQLVRCKRILGRVPDTGKVGNPATPFGRAVDQVNKEFNLVYDYTSQQPSKRSGAPRNDAAAPRGDGNETRGTLHKDDASPRWASRKILVMDAGSAYRDLQTDSITELEEKYDPVLYYTEDRGGILSLPTDVIPMQAWHPGYVDFYVWQTGERAHRERARRFVLSRVKDSMAMRDPRLHAWLKDNRIELVNQRDALYGTREYQNHLRTIGSDLAVA